MTSMTKERRKRVAKPPEERLDDLLRAALSVFVEKGINAAAISDITDCANLAKGTFYLYFRSKDQVVGILWERHVEGLLTVAATVLEAAGPPSAKRITTFLEALIRHTLGNADLHRLVYSSADAAALELCRASNERLIALLADEIRAAVEAGTLCGELTPSAARFIFQGAHGALHAFIMAGGSDEPEAFIASVTTMIRRLLRPGENGSPT